MPNSFLVEDIEEYVNRKSVESPVFVILLNLVYFSPFDHTESEIPNVFPCKRKSY